jgi:hypothetical protein
MSLTSSLRAHEINSATKLFRFGTWLEHRDCQKSLKLPVRKVGQQVTPVRHQSFDQSRATQKHRIDNLQLPTVSTMMLPGRMSEPPQSVNLSAPCAISAFNLDRRVARS